jgi:trimethylamine--corrinoid protein Co-methyltransferase
MDADFCGALHRYLEGVSLDPDEFALDGFHEVGPGRHFFGSQHTLRHYETAFYDSPTADNNSFEQWRDAGESRTEERAAVRVAETLANYVAPPLDEATDEALLDYIGRKKASMPDMWY